MSSSPGDSRKVVIAGAGDVGASFAYALSMEGCAEEIVLVDVRREQAQGQAMDLADGLPFLPPVRIHAGDKSDYADAAVVVITAGTRQKPDESRLDLTKRNAAIMKSIVGDVTARGCEAVLVIVSNPVDVLTRIALECSGLPKNRVMGAGTVLDSARFRYLLSRHCGVDARNVHAYVLGEHGDSEVAAWSMTHIGGTAIDTYCAACARCADGAAAREKIVRDVRESAYHIIDYKGSTCYAVGLALVRIVAAILRNEHSVLTVSSLLEGEYGIHDVCLSVPCVLGETGVERIVPGKLFPDEMEGLRRSAEVIRSEQKEHRYPAR